MSNHEVSTRPQLTDRAVQVAYICAYRLMRAYWRLRRPTTHGALVALWSNGRVLLIRNSYVRYYSAPGGYVQPTETGKQAAIRELAEEVSVHARPEQLVLALDVTHEWEGKHDHVQIFNLEVDVRPTVQIDHREVVDANWFEPVEALELELFPPLRRVIEKQHDVSRTMLRAGAVRADSAFATDSNTAAPDRRKARPKRSG